jgi:hypothetical protein
VIGTVNTRESWEASARWVAREHPEALRTVTSFANTLLRRRGMNVTGGTKRKHWGRLTSLYELTQTG